MLREFMSGSASGKGADVKDASERVGRVFALLREVAGEPGALFVVERGPAAIVEAWVDPHAAKVELSGGWAAVESGAWHCHLDLARVAAVRFVEEADVHDPTRKAFSASLLDGEANPLLVIFFAATYDESGALVPEKVSRFRALKERFGDG